MSVDTKLIVNLTRGTALCRSEFADRLGARVRDLAGRGAPPPGQGLLVRPAPALHTLVTRSPIDALLLDRELRVLEIRRELRPWRVASAGRARTVLELASGEAHRLGVRVGDQLSVHEGSPVAVVPEPETPAAGVRCDGPIPIHARRGGSERAVCDELSVGTAPGGARDKARGALALAPEPGRRDREDDAAAPLSVLVISPDRRFRSVTTVLIARRGCAVATTEHAGRLAELTERVAADVVVIDLDEGAPASADAVALARSLPRGIGIVLVDEEGSVAATADRVERVHCKWGPFAALFAAIEDADRERPDGSVDDDVA